MLRENLKILARFISLVLVFPIYLVHLFTSLLVGREESFRAYSHFFSIWPGLKGDYVRREFYRLSLRYCSKSAVISFGVLFSSTNVEIGENVYIGPYSIIGNAVIGRDTLIASRVSIISGLHQHGIDRTDIPIREQIGEFITVNVGEDCWLGEGAIVAADIGAHSVVAAGSVVLSELQRNSIAGGNPAKLLRTR